MVNLTKNPTTRASYPGQSSQLPDPLPNRLRVHGGLSLWCLEEGKVDRIIVYPFSLYLP